jgi:hypothetical protein
MDNPYKIVDDSNGTTATEDSTACDLFNANPLQHNTTANKLFNATPFECITREPKKILLAADYKKQQKKLQGRPCVDDVI